MPSKRKHAYDLIAPVVRHYFFECRNERGILGELARRSRSLEVKPRSPDRLVEEIL